MLPSQTLEKLPHRAARHRLGTGLFLALILAAAVRAWAGQVGPAETAQDAGVSAAPQVAGLPATVEALLSAPAAGRAHWGISVVDAATGAPLYSRNEGQLFEPASNAKLFTTAAALALLGPVYTMQTRVLAEGPVTPDGRLHGTLRLIGGGDPTLSGRVYPYSGKTERDENPIKALDDLAAQVAAAGIQGIDGAVVGDDTLFVYERYDPGWAWDDLQWDYGAPVSALTVNDNVRYLLITPGARAGMPVTLGWNPAVSSPPSGSFLTDATPVTPGAGALDDQVVTAAPGSEAHLGLRREPDSGMLVAYGSVAAGSSPRSIAIALEDPAAFAAAALQGALLARGIAASSASHSEHRASRDLEPFARETREPMPAHPVVRPAFAGRVVARRTSPPLSAIVTVTNKISQNLHAELLLRLLGAAAGDDGSIAQGVRVVRQFLVGAGIDPQDFTFVDGSGLSQQDLITPRAVTTLLVYAARQPWGGVYRASLPVGGVDGSLASRFTASALKGRVTAKTGTLAEVNTLSGYLSAASGRSLAFSILCNGYPGEGSRATMDRVVEALAGAF